jgi:hypothetical protein
MLSFEYEFRMMLKWNLNGVKSKEEEVENVNAMTNGLEASVNP